MKKKYAVKKIIKVICLLMTVGILCIIPQLEVRASAMDTDLTGEQEQRTNIDEPGSSDSRGDLSEINIANNMTVTMIALAPFLLIMLTSFTRVIIVLHFTRAALNTQTAPPNQVMIGLALFLTFFIMQPTATAIYQEAFVPFDQGTITQEEFFEAGIEPLREFMYRQTQTKDVKVFMSISGTEWDGSLEGIPITVLVPSFIVGELRQAFIIGFLIYIPFIVIGGT